MIKDLFKNPFARWSFIIFVIYAVFFHESSDQFYLKQLDSINNEKSKTETSDIAFKINEKEQDFKERVASIKDKITNSNVSQVLIEEFVSSEIQDKLGTQDNLIISSTIKGIPTKKVINQGGGARINCGDTIQAKLSGNYFSSNKKGQLPEEFIGEKTLRIGSSGLFPSLDKEFIGERKGSKLEISLPPLYAFKNSTLSHKDIPEDSIVKYEVDITEVNPTSFKIRRPPNVTTKVAGNSLPIGCGDSVSINYVLFSFASYKSRLLSPKEGRNVSFKVGDGTIPIGLEEAITGMRLGQVSNVIIHPDQIYNLGENQIPEVDELPENYGFVGVIAITALNGSKSEKEIELIPPGTKL